jgi:glycosyltransferase involved in cell wall biosynthesis
MASMRLLIVSENISMQMGGESSLPFFYAKLLAQRGVEVWLACHERVETEVRAAFPELGSRIRLVKDTKAQKLLYRYSEFLPYRVRDLLVGQALHLSTQRRIRKIALELARAGKIDVLLEPSPITPKGVSFMYDIGVPVAIGPLCGGMTFPPAFVAYDSLVTRTLMAIGRHGSQLANKIVPGKLKADVLFVANELTEKALPSGHRGQVIRLFESGVDLDLWKPSDTPKDDDIVRFIFSGRFVDWKGIKYLVSAFAKVVAQEPKCRLDLIGGGELEGEIRETITEFKLTDAIELHGWIGRSEAASLIKASDIFMMPSLRECGGTAILEAMATGKPVVATKWGGPSDYINQSCGILVEPNSKEGFIQGLTDAMLLLARSPQLRKRLGEGGKRRVLQDSLDWKSKADRVFTILSELLYQHRSNHTV